MSKFYFFTDPSLLDAQTAAQAFGPAGTAAGEDQFRVTDIHTSTASTDIPAFAVCDGLILAQDAGNNLVNLILKPTEQPPFAFPKIRFFIYRGIKKDTLVSGDDVAPSTNNDLTKSIWESQQKKNTSAGTSDNAPAKALGIDITDNAPIDDVFYRENVSYQLQLVKPGWSLGEFDPAEFGFEIMVEAIGFDPELPLARTAANIINVTALPASPTPAEEFEHWHDKEAILNYIDPCAFFGGFYFHTLRVKHADDSVSKKKKNEVYDDVLKGAHLTGANDGVFLNRNKTYLDIRNEYNHSINYFKNYGTYTNTDINCAFSDTDPLTARNYYANGWPLMAIDNGDLPAGNTTARKNTIRIALPDGAGDNPLPTLYISAGHLDDLFPREPKDTAKLIDLNVTVGFTDEVVLAIPNRDDLSSTTAISTYIKLKYFKRFNPTAGSPPLSSGTVIRASNYLDNLFIPFDMKIPFSGNPSVGLMVYEEESFIFVTTAPHRDYVSRVGLATDLDYVTLFSYPLITRASSNRVAVDGFHIGPKKKYWKLSYLNKVESEGDRTTLLKGSLTHSNSDIPFLLLSNGTDGKQGAKFVNPDDLVAVVITQSEYAQLVNLYQSSFTNRFRTYLGVVATNKVDDDSMPFVQLDLVLRGLAVVDDSLPTERYEVNEVATNLKLYSHGDI